MIITDTQVTGQDYLNRMPDHFQTDKAKQKPNYVKWLVDYYANQGYQQYWINRKTFVKNYDLLKGIIDIKDFYQEDSRYKSFIDNIIQQEELPAYIKHYPIINPPINTMIGELTKRPDNHRVRAFDSYSQNEELSFKTDVLQNYILQEAYAKIIQKLQLQGQDISKIDPNDLQQMSYDSVKEQLTDYTSEGEIWGNATVEALKAELRLKDKTQDMFRDLLTSNHEFGHIYEDNSKRGFNFETVNPKNFFRIGGKDEKYLDRCSVVGIVRVMEMTEILERFQNLDTDEIQHLIDQTKEENNPNKLVTRAPNIWSDDSGWGSVTYDIRDAEREIVRVDAGPDYDTWRKDLRFSDVYDTYGPNNRNYFTVVEFYVWSKKKIGKLDYLDQQGNEQSILVDESYKVGSPNELNIEWGWVNQLYKGIKIGSDIYRYEPFTLLESFPIIGVTHEVKNTESVSLVDLMKPFQVLYNICMNQLYELLGKEIGVIHQASLRYIPTPKDGDEQDTLDIWIEEAKKSGVVFLDDRPENTRGGAANPPLSRVDLTRSQEMETRYQLAAQLKLECWELVGFNRQRLGSIAASETAQGTQTALSQSYAQTEPWFQQHEYVLDKIYQSLLDAAQYIESNKEVTTLSYLNNQGTAAFIKMTGDSLKPLDLHLVSVSRPQDNLIMQEMRQLAQPLIQNGASMYDVSTLFTSNSIREYQKVMKSIEDKAEKLQQQQLAQQQQQQQQEAQQFQAQQQLQEQARQEEIQNDNYNKQLDRQNRIQVATISSIGGGKVTPQEVTGNENIYQNTTLNLQAKTLQNKQDVELQKIALKDREILSKIELQNKNIELQKSNKEADIKIAKIQLSNGRSK